MRSLALVLTVLAFRPPAGTPVHTFEKVEWRDGERQADGTVRTLDATLTFRAEASGHYFAECRLVLPPGDTLSSRPVGWRGMQSLILGFPVTADAHGRATLKVSFDGEELRSSRGGLGELQLTMDAVESAGSAVPRHGSSPLFFRSATPRIDPSRFDWYRGKVLAVRHRFVEGDAVLVEVDLRSHGNPPRHSGIDEDFSVSVSTANAFARDARDVDIAPGLHTERFRLDLLTDADSVLIFPGWKRLYPRNPVPVDRRKVRIRLSAWELGLFDQDEIWGEPRSERGWQVDRRLGE